MLKVEDICEILDAQRKPVSKKDRRVGCYPYYGATGIQDYVDAYIFDGRYLLVGEDGAKWGASDKTAFMVEGKCWVNNHAHILKINKKVIDTYVEYYLTFKDLNEYITGAIVPKLTQQALRNIPIPVPPLSEQERIVAELDCLSSVIEKQKELLKELDNLAQSTFYTMFGDPITNEKGWEVKKLGEICYSELGKMLDTKKNTGTLHPYLCALNVQWGTFNLDIIKEMKIEEEDLERYEVKKGDLLICEGGDTGRCAIWNNDDIIYYQNSLHRVRFAKEYMLPIVCQYIMLHYKKQGEIDKYSTGQTIKHLVKKSLLTIPFPIAPLSLQQEFASKIEAIEKQKELIKQSIAETETLFNSRMDYYFN